MSFTLSDTLPENAQALDVGHDDDREFYLAVSPWSVYGATLRLYVRQGERLAASPVAELQKPRYDAFVAQAQNSDYYYAIRVLNSPDRLGAVVAQAFAEVISVGAGMVLAFNESIQDRVSEYEAKAAEQEAERKRQREEWDALQRRRAVEREARREREAIAARQAWIDQNKRARQLYEHVRWLLEHQFRLKRDGKKSTVFGTIKSVSEPYETTARRPYNQIGPANMDYTKCIMHTVSERGVQMAIKLADINCFDVKYDGEKRFNNIYTA
jgi:hypothetical protein